VVDDGRGFTPSEVEGPRTLCCAPVRPLAVLLLLFSLPAGAAEELWLLAAASTAEPAEAAAKAFELANHVSVHVNLGASSELSRQIRAGAPADVFLSADGAQMDAVQRTGWVAAQDRAPLLTNSLVVVVPLASKLHLEKPDDLAQAKVLALADPEAVPAGVYAKKWLTSLGLWDRLKAKVVPASDVRAALAAVEAERADAAIVYATDARVAKKARAVESPSLTARLDITYWLAPVGKPPKPLAKKLAAFLQSADGRASFAKAGFGLAP
jgi:molybdate transport system substrate-binding protein